MEKVKPKIEVVSVQVEEEEEAGPSQQSSGSDAEPDEEQEEAGPSSRRKKKRNWGPLSKLNANLKGLMGEANLRYARGDIEMAQKMCFEIMRQVPDAFEPYITLAQIFENVDMTKYEGYLAIASSLCSTDPVIWCRLAELKIQQEKIKDAITYYGRAVRADPTNIENHLKRLNLALQIGDSRSAMVFRRYMANHLPKSQAGTIIEICKEIAKQYHEERNYIKALEALEIPFKRVPKKVTPDLVNMMLELMLITNRFAEILDCFIQFCNFTFEVTVSPDREITIMSYQMPPNLPIDLKVKFMSCLIKMKSATFVSLLINKIIVEENVEDIGDLFLDLAEDLMVVGYHQEALKLLIPLVKSKNFNLGAVWMKYADCLQNCDMLEQAVEAYFTVMTMVPQHVEVLYPLAMTLLKLNKKSEALAVLSQDLTTNTVDVAVLMERIKLLRLIGDLEDYWKFVELLLSRHCLVIKYPEEISYVLTKQTYKDKLKQIQKFRKFRGDFRRVESNFESVREPSAEEEYKFFQDILNFALEKREYAQLERFATIALTSKRFQKNYKELILYTYFGCLLNHDTYHGFTLIRDLITHHLNNNLAWNLFNGLLQFADDLRHYRFIVRLQERLPQCLQTVEANYGLSVGNYTLAMKYYMEEFRKHRSPYFSFILGVILLNCFSKRLPIANKQHLSEITSFLFLHYLNNRSKDAESEAFYNLGRMYHQLGVPYLAEFYYLKVLENPKSEIIEKHENILDLKYEAAYNLHIIYKNSGNFARARNILIKYIVI